MKKIGIVGCGAIGTEIARAIKKKIIPAQLVAVCDIDVARCQLLIKNARVQPAITSLSKLVAASDIVVESAGVQAVKDISQECLKKHKTLLIMSAGYLLKDPNLIQRAEKNKCSIIIPSGALAGLDALKAANCGKIHSVTLTTTKPPKGLQGAPYFINHPVNFEKLKKPKVIFDGTASQAVKGFPKNINVSAILSCAGIGPKRTRVRIIADPLTKTNTHEVKITGTAGIITTRTENVPSPTNPKTSYLAILSAISVLRQICVE